MKKLSLAKLAEDELKKSEMKSIVASNTCACGCGCTCDTDYRGETLNSVRLSNNGWNRGANNDYSGNVWDIGSRVIDGMWGFMEDAFWGMGMTFCKWTRRAFDYW